jgi:hypothetical protein
VKITLPVTNTAALEPLAKAFSESARKAALEARRAKAKGKASAGGKQGELDLDGKQAEQAATNKEMYEGRPSRKLKDAGNGDLLDKGDDEEVYGPGGKSTKDPVDVAAEKDRTDKRDKALAEAKASDKDRESRLAKKSNAHQAKEHAAFARVRGFNSLPPGRKDSRHTAWPSSRTEQRQGSRQIEPTGVTESSSGRAREARGGPTGTPWEKPIPWQRSTTRKGLPAHTMPTETHNGVERARAQK